MYKDNMAGSRQQSEHTLAIGQANMLCEFPTSSLEEIWGVLANCKGGIQGVVSAF